MFAVTQVLITNKGIYAFLGTFTKLRKMIISFIMSVHLSIVKEANAAPYERILKKYDILVLFKNLSKKFEFL